MAGQLRNGGVAHDLTDEERARGNANRWAEYRRKRAEAERLALEKLADELKPSIDTLLEIRDNTEDAASDRRQAAIYVIDRVLGKPTQHTELTGSEGGPVVVENDVNADQAEAVIRSLVDAGLIVVPSANGDAPADEVHSAPAD